MNKLITGVASDLTFDSVSFLHSSTSPFDSFLNSLPSTIDGETKNEKETKGKSYRLAKFCSRLSLLDY